MSDQDTMQDPNTQYPKPDGNFEQYQDGPGLEQDMEPKPDASGKTYHPAAWPPRSSAPPSGATER